jgi:catechol 2,3-dioxygenase-like lactoylglutathione lyase family enzyme
MITGIDHVAIQVRDLEQTVASYIAIFGREPDWRGHMQGARHAWFQFANMALDVIGADGDNEIARGIRGDIGKHGEGIWGLGFAVADLAGTRSTLERRGIELMPTHVTRSQNAQGATREWTLAIAKRKSACGLAQFFVQIPDDPKPVRPAAGAEVAGLDHIVVNTANPDRAMAHYGARLGLDLRLDRSNEQWGSRLLFFRCGGAVVEVGTSLKAPPSNEADRYGGLAWRVSEPEMARARIAAAGIDVSEVRKGRKPGTHVFTVRSGTGGVPTLMLAGNQV